MSDYDDNEEVLEHEADDEVVVEQKSAFELLTTPHQMDDSEIKCIQVQNNVMAILGTSGRFVASDQLGDIDQYDDKVPNPHKLFLDPAGTHVLISTTNGELHYFNLRLRTKPLRFFPATSQIANQQSRAAQQGRPVVIESVAWDKHAEFEEISTGTLLLGTREGLKIYQLMISVDRDSTAKIDDCREIAALPVADDRYNSCPIIGIESDQLNDHKCIFVATPCNLYGVSGSELDTFEEIFSNPAFLSINMPVAADQKGSFNIFRSVIGVGKLTGPPHSFLWTYSGGLIHGLFAKPLTKASHNAGDLESDNIVAQQEYIQFGPRYEGGFRRVPSEAVHSAFNMFIIHEEKLVVLGHPAGLKWAPPDGISLKWQDFEEKIRFAPFRHRTTKTKGVVWDEAKHKAYCYNNTDVWELNVERESAGHWRPFLERAVDFAENPQMRERYFEAAMKLTRDVPAKRDIVAMHFGRYWLKKGREYGAQAVAVLEKCTKFEEVYHLLAKERPDLLLPYIKHRYTYMLEMRKAGTEFSQIACLVAVVTAMHLEEIAKINNTDKATIAKQCDELSAFLHTTNVREPRLFEENRYYLMVHNLIASHGHDKVILDLAKDLKQWRFTVGYSTMQQNYEGAVAILDSFCGEKLDIWVEFAATLMEKRPIQFLESVRRNPRLEKSLHQLIPAFLTYKPSNNEVKTSINYLHQFLFNTLQGFKLRGDGDDDAALTDDTTGVMDDGLGTWEVPSTTVKNFYVSLLVSHSDYAEELRKYLAQTDDYTPEFALRLCLENKLLPACVQLYRAMKFPQDAVEVALEIGQVDVAKDIVLSLPAETQLSLKKRVWILLIEYYVEHGQVAEAIQYINSSGGIVKMEDVLSKVTDSTVIQGFKEPICQRLETYSQQIQELTEDMKHATESAKNIKDDIACLKARYGYVSATQRCEICRKSLLHGSQPFLVFPSCRHVYHEHCVVDRLGGLGGVDWVRSKCPDPTYLEGVHNDTDLAMTECIFCGEVAILEINAPFIIAGGDRAWIID
jgi:hypothetical protein